MSQRHQEREPGSRLGQARARFASLAAEVDTHLEHASRAGQRELPRVHLLKLECERAATKLLKLGKYEAACRAAYEELLDALAGISRELAAARARQEDRRRI